MQAITGWRFLLTIALPLVLASLGAVGLAYDLLNKVQNSGDAAERSRNEQVINEALHTVEADMARLVVENARWESAAAATSAGVDNAWFQQTWGSAMSLSKSYDVVAVLDQTSGKVLAIKSTAGDASPATGLFQPETFQALQGQLPAGGTDGMGLVTGFAQTFAGPAIVATAPIVSPDRDNRPNGKLLVLGRFINAGYLASLERQLLVTGLALTADEESGGIALRGFGGKVDSHLTWRDRDMGAMLTFSAWTKASAVLGFLLLVMTGIGTVCWRLIQQLVSNEEVASHNALHDHLTGLPNRLSLIQHMRSAHAENNTAYTLAFADLDGFKEVNDSYGHEYGDKLICMVAAGVSRLAQHARVCSRLGGDEFIVMFTGETSEAEAKTFATRLIQMLGSPFDMDGRMAAVGASIGIAHNAGVLDDTEMLRRSDIAMYKAKAEGKNRYCVFDESFDAERAETLSIAAEMKDIIARDAMDIVFQPVVSARTGAITGVEALARWPKTSQRKFGADKFIPIAEKSGLIDDLGEMMLRKACAAARDWPTLRLAINISAVQLNNPDFVQRALAILYRANIPPNRMEFEITETSDRKSVV